MMSSLGFGLVLAMFSCQPCRDQLSKVCLTWHFLMSVIITFWFIAGNVWIYYDLGPHQECNRSFFLFSFLASVLLDIISPTPVQQVGDIIITATMSSAVTTTNYSTVTTTRDSTSRFQRLRSRPQVSIQTVGFSELFACSLLFAYIAIGSVYLNECPRQPYIPIYLIVMGVFGLVVSLLSSLPFAPRGEEDEVSNPVIGLFVSLHSLMSFFLFCWFIAGNVWIYSIYQPNYDKNTTLVEPYCNKTLYLFAFWSTTVGYIFLALSVFCCCCCCCFAPCVALRAADESAAEAGDC